MYMRRKTRSILVALCVGLFIAAIAGGVLSLTAVRLGESHEDGYSVGTLINVRQEGVLWSRPAATLLHTGELKGDEFALDTEALYTTANAYADKGARVKVKYLHRYVCWAWNYASCNIITEISADPGSTTPLEGK